MARQLRCLFGKRARTSLRLVATIRRGNPEELPCDSGTGHPGSSRRLIVICSFHWATPHFTSWWVVLFWLLASDQYPGSLPTGPMSLVLVPSRMRRPSMAGWALCLCPLVQASRADTARIECVPGVAAGARPKVPPSWPPAAQRAANAAAGCTGIFILPLLDLDVGSSARHVEYYQSKPGIPMAIRVRINPCDCFCLRQ